MNTAQCIEAGRPVLLADSPPRAWPIEITLTDLPRIPPRCRDALKRPVGPEWYLPAQGTRTRAVYEALLRTGTGMRYPEISRAIAWRGGALGSILTALKEAGLVTSEGPAHRKTWWAIER